MSEIEVKKATKKKVITNKPFKAKKPELSMKEELEEALKRYPKHYIDISMIIKNNAEIRRFTSIGIINYLLQKKEIKGTKRYVSYKWTKFSVCCDNLVREYSYTEPFFLNCLVAAFSSFSASAQKTINGFCRKEMSVGIDKGVDMDEVNNIVKETNAHVEREENEASVSDKQ